MGRERERSREQGARSKMGFEEGTGRRTTGHGLQTTDYGTTELRDNRLRDYGTTDKNYEPRGTGRWSVGDPARETDVIPQITHRPWMGGLGDRALGLWSRSLSSRLRRR